MMGIGGTGVVTVNQVLGTAALLDGLHVSGLDQTGLSQKGGPVVSDLRISREPLAAATKAPRRRASTSTWASTCSARPPTRTSSPPRPTAASRSSRPAPCRPAAWWSTSTSASPSSPAQLDRIDGVTRREHNIYLDAQQLSERLFGDHMMTQHARARRGLPARHAAGLRRRDRAGHPAQRRRGREEPRRVRWGRAVVAAPDAVEQATPRARGAAPRAADAERALVDAGGQRRRRRAAPAARGARPRAGRLPGRGLRPPLRRIVRRVHVAEQERTPGQTG